MAWIDYLIVIVPIIGLIGISVYSRKFARGVVDYLAAGRVAGRYVLCVGDMMAGLSVITIVAGVEQNYQTGFSVTFWNALLVPLGILLALFGYCVYRWRETRCLSIGQFLELRYGSRFFRVFCASLRTIAEMITNSIGPAIATNFFIYYLGLPHKVMIWGVSLPCYGIIVFLCLCLALIFIWPGGRISLLVTDAIQGIFSYPIFVIIIGYVFLHFSWSQDIAPTMWNRAPGESFINPYDISQLRDFNLFALIATIFASFFTRASWLGNDSNNSGRTPHEQKMAAILGTWRTGFGLMSIVVLSMITITFMNSGQFKTPERHGISSGEVRQILSERILGEAVSDPVQRQKAAEAIRNVTISDADWARPKSQSDNLDTPYFTAVRTALGDTAQGRYEFQKFRSLYNQMMMPTLLGLIFPVGLLGLFCLLMIMLLVSSDDSRIFNASSTLMQDVILPFFSKHLSSSSHILLLRLTSVGVAVFFFVVAMFFAQLDYINMFVTIMCSVWIGGGGPVMLFGLYSRFGNLAGAWSAIILGSGTSLFGLLCQRNWAQTIYPWLEKMGWVEDLDAFLKAISGPFHPWIVWQMDSVKFPINSYEISCISIMLAVLGYIIVSFLTYKPYNLDQLLHRGVYADEHSLPPPEPWTLQNCLRKILNITPEYSRGDKVLAWIMFFYSFGYCIILSFVMVVIWNCISPWPKEWWNIYFFICTLLVPSIIGIVSTVWFMIGGVIDLRRLFQDLAKRVDNPEDNGQILRKDQ